MYGSQFWELGGSVEHDVRTIRMDVPSLLVRGTLDLSARLEYELGELFERYLLTRINGPKDLVDSCFNFVHQIPPSSMK